MGIGAEILSKVLIPVVSTIESIRKVRDYESLIALGLIALFDLARLAPMAYLLDKHSTHLESWVYAVGIYASCGLITALLNILF